MGIGSKPFMDIKPSDAAISDRAIDYIMKGTGELSPTLAFVSVVYYSSRSIRDSPPSLFPLLLLLFLPHLAAHCLSLLTEARTRASIAVPSFEHASSFKRPHSTISNSSTSSSSSQSSSSLLGSLNLHLYSSPSHRDTHSYPASVPSFAQWPYDCIEEDELEQDSGSQPSMSEFFYFIYFFGW